MRTLIGQIKLYRLLSILFLCTGLFTFILLYLRNIEGRLLDALSEPMTIIMIVFPFIPAVILSILAKSSEKKFLVLKEKQAKKDKQDKA